MRTKDLSSIGPLSQEHLWCCIVSHSSVPSKDQEREIKAYLILSQAAPNVAVNRDNLSAAHLAVCVFRELGMQVRPSYQQSARQSSKKHLPAPSALDKHEGERG